MTCDDIDVCTTKINICNLPEEVLERILSLLSPYTDLQTAKLVCRTWNRFVKGIIERHQSNFHRCLRNYSVDWQLHCPVSSGRTIVERYSHCSVYYNKSLYIFGGCTSSNTTFNDLWRYDLQTDEWVRPLAMGIYPCPKACASLVTHRDQLVLFGGWAHPSPYPLHQGAKLFSELHTYTPDSSRWSLIQTTYGPPATAGHSASVYGDLMVVFGGCHTPGVGSDSVWVFDLVLLEWHRQQTSSPRPLARYGQSQCVVQDHLLMIGGCGGPNQIFSDMWLLEMKGDVWQWSEVLVDNMDFGPPQLWCHQACKVGESIIVLSKPSKVTVGKLTDDKLKQEVTKEENDRLHQQSQFLHKRHQQQLKSRSFDERKDSGISERSPDRLPNDNDIGNNVDFNNTGSNSKEITSKQSVNGFSSKFSDRTSPTKPSKLMTLTEFLNSTASESSSSLCCNSDISFVPSGASGGLDISQGDFCLDDSVFMEEESERNYYSRIDSGKNVSGQNESRQNVSGQNESGYIGSRSSEQSGSDKNFVSDGAEAGPSWRFSQNCDSNDVSAYNADTNNENDVCDYENSVKNDISDRHTSILKQEVNDVPKTNTKPTKHDLTLNINFNSNTDKPKVATSDFNNSMQEQNNVVISCDVSKGDKPRTQSHPSIRPNANRNRQKQLDMLQRYSERIRQLSTRSSTDRDRQSAKKIKPDTKLKSPTSPEPKDIQSTLCLHVLDISDVVMNKTAKWIPLTYPIPSNSPEETVFYSLAEGRCELLMFGGLHRDLTSMSRGVDIKSHTISNKLHRIHAKFE